MIKQRPWIAYHSFFLAAVSLCWCIYRDMQIEKQYPGDLRNRIVGSRLQMDGISPYFFHWKPADGLRYYDWNNDNNTLKISNVTASPFFHQLLYPVANLPQRTVSKLWLVLEYLALLTMTLIALQLAKESKQKIAVLFISLFFLYTYAWTTNVAVGQMYVFIALLAMLFYFFISRKVTLFNAVSAGIIGMSMLLVRPNTALFLLPFLLLAGRYTLQYKAALLISALLVLAFAFGSGHSRVYWSDYRKALGEQLKLHQDLGPAVAYSAPVPKYQQWEGWDVAQIDHAARFPYYKHNSENGNVFVFLNLALHVKTPVWLLSFLCFSFMAGLCVVYYKTCWCTPRFGTYSVALLGFCLYMATDVFSPIHRAHYNASQWIFPLLLTASAFSSQFSRMYVTGIIAGLLLNSFPFSLFPMQRTIGEYLMFASVLGLLFTFKQAYKK